uniref:Uncharacterized protein n=1 Tax=Panagrolaimus sp. ES5 TaxID=591445 RepID=A0AC34FWT0_9BILA
MEFLMTKCQDKKAGRTKEWFHLRPQNCKVIPVLEEYHSISDDTRDIVFIAQMPHPRSGLELEYSPWFQFLLGMMDVEIEYSAKNCKVIPVLEEYHSISDDTRDIVFIAQMPHPRSGLELEYSPWFQFLLGMMDVEIEYSDKVVPEPKFLIEFEIRMGYRTKADSPYSWNEFITTTIQRNLECSIDPDKRKPGYFYNCSTIDLFELGANNYPFYLLNIRLPINRTRCKQDMKAPNCQLPPINDLRVIAIHQNGGFTAIWLWMKTLLCPLVVLATLWYYKRVAALNKPM